MSLKGAIEVLAEKTKISQYARQEIEDELEETAEAEIDRDLDEIRNAIENIEQSLDEQLDRVERLEAETGLRGNSNESEE